MWRLTSGMQHTSGASSYCSQRCLASGGEGSAGPRFGWYLFPIDHLKLRRDRAGALVRHIAVKLTETVWYATIISVAAHPSLIFTTFLFTHCCCKACDDKRNTRRELRHDGLALL
jgi:hypothetical protein